MDNQSSVAFGEACEFFVSTVALVAAGDWERPGIGEWSVRELVAHANRAQTTVVDYIEHPQAPVAPGSDYFSDASISARAKQAVVDLADDPAAAVRAAADAAVGLVGRSGPETPVGMPMATITLAQYLPSRTAELVIHALDVGRAVGQELEVPASALQECLRFVAQRAGQKAGLDVVLALTGRGSLPDGFSIY
jgi:uncharacterized protein (TIGR03083 family)